MSALRAALWSESLKARRSRVPWLTATGFSLAPLMGGLFMVILKDPQRARSLGLLGTKAQLAGGVADWPAYFGLLAQATAVGGAVLFALVSAWVFGREFADRTAKEWLAVPAPRAAVVTAKFAVIVVWALALTALVIAMGLGIGAAVGLPAWSMAGMWRGIGRIFLSAVLALALMPLVALWTCAGRSYLPGLGWAMLTVFLAQILAALGWGAWFPWSVPPLVSGLAGPDTGIGMHSYALVALVCLIGLAGTYAWWLRVDHTH